MNENIFTNAELAAALVAFQGEITNPKKTHTAHIVSGRTGGKFAYHYAPLAEIADHVKPILSKRGLAVIQMVSANNVDLTVLATRLYHKSGQYIESCYPIPKLTDPQAMGSAVTYARRYSLCAILGIAAEDDDDGNAAEEAEQKESDAAEEQKKADALARLEKLKAEGRFKSAHAEPDMKVELKDGTVTVDVTAEEKLPPTELAEVTGTLGALMKADGITPAMLKAYYTGRKHLPATVQPADLTDPKHADYTAKLVKNWKAAVAVMKKGAK